jgi:lauroyl/myristoyl acyltransferase
MNRLKTLIDFFHVNLQKLRLHFYRKNVIVPTIRRVSPQLVEVIRIVSMQFILAPFARVLPKKVAVAIANFIALFLFFCPEPGYDIYRQMKRVFGGGCFSSVKLTLGWLALPLREFLVNERFINKLENPSNRIIDEINTDGINRLRRSRESYILVSGHFSKEAGLILSSPEVSCNRPFHISYDTSKQTQNLHDLRVKLQLGTYQKALYSCWGETLEFLMIGGDLRSTTKLYNSLRKPGNVVMIALDAMWDKTLIGSYQRSFAGEKNRTFSMGAVQLARLTGCPLICCIPWIKDDGNIVLEWGDVIRIDSKDTIGEIKAMNILLDTLEIAVGKRPTQYYFEIGDDRRWDSQKERWEDI